MKSLSSCGYVEMEAVEGQAGSEQRRTVSHPAVNPMTL